MENILFFLFSTWLYAAGPGSDLRGLRSGRAHGVSGPPGQVPSGAGIIRQYKPLSLQVPDGHDPIWFTTAKFLTFGNGDGGVNELELSQVLHATNAS